MNCLREIPGGIIRIRAPQAGHSTVNPEPAVGSSVTNRLPHAQFTFIEAIASTPFLKSQPLLMAGSF
ncbi:50S ribosomal protein L31 [Thermoanaerobacterium thermosaccharolyticum]|uniref:50S ribosomal protein L31 n=1 Tax=Thermoanaerobacterium thermosaccharolyticum TaxID=1517 RepID=A0A223HWV4_THETR|nr:50S ribosomal protein L31 [Thermoanaerobacterium thermosaccharolyticum]